MEKRELMLSDLKHHLLRAQCRMKNQADKHRSDRVFKSGDWVWLKLQPYKQVSLIRRSNHKLSQKYFGLVGKVAYKLTLPAAARIHNVFHVSLLKAFHGTPPVVISVPGWMQLDDFVPLHPQALLQTRILKVHNVVQVQYLIKWQGKPDYEATWEIAESFVKQFPDFPIAEALAQLQS